MMKFLYPQFLWLSLAFIIPWIFFLFQILFSKKEKIPSLIFIKESNVNTDKFKKKILVYLLQSILLFLPGVILAELSFTSNVSKFTCVVDDLIHSQFTLNKWQKMKSNLQTKCNHQFISLADLSNNEIKMIDKNNLKRNVNISYLNAFLFLVESLKNKEQKLLFITPKKNYHIHLSQLLEKVSSKKLYYYPIKLQDDKNFYFEKINLNKHVFDFRKRELVIQGNLPYAKNATVFIERKNEKISVTLDDNAQASIVLNVDFSMPIEWVKISLRGDKFLEDNFIYLPMMAQKEINYIYQENQIPKTIQALLEVNAQKFPYFWFKKKQSKNSFEIGWQESIHKLKFANKILFVRKNVDKNIFQFMGPRFIDNLYSSFQKYYFYETFNFSNNNSFTQKNEDVTTEIITRFKDGSPAIVKESSRNNRFIRGYFLFNPDTVDKKLKSHPDFPIFLLDILLHLIEKNNMIIIDNEAKRERYIPLLKNTSWKTGVYITDNKQNQNWKINSIISSLNRLEKLIINKKVQNKIFIFKWNTSATKLSNIELPLDNIIISKENKNNFFSFQKIGILLFIILLLFIFYLEKPSKK